MTYAIGFLLGWFGYHYLMNRAVMMRRCCVEHFATHERCECIDCAREREERDGKA